MIQQINPRQPSVVVAPLRQPANDSPEIWGQWSGRKHYSLEVVQHPLRARMCGFGDKDRRPLAPAAVAKMIVRREDNTIVDVDDVDCSFFLVTVDLWSADGKHEMNLVLHPSSADRYVPPHVATKSRRRGASTSAPQLRPSGNQTPAGTSTPTPSQYRPGEQGYFPPTQAPVSEGLSFPTTTPYGSTNSENPSTWGYPPPAPPVDRSASFPPPVLPSIHSFGRGSSATNPESWTSESSSDIHPYRAWSTDAAYAPVDNFSNAQVDPALRNPSNPENRENPGWSQPEGYNPAPPNSQVDQPVYGSGPYHQSPSSYQTVGPYPQTVPGTPPPQTSANIPPLPRHTYTRTLVGPLSANACRLLDEHRKPGIFFLFQDLSVRTEGTFRLRMRLMNVGAPPAPEVGAMRVHNDVSPVLAQTFTEHFTVYSAKRFPGVPDTTALSIAFGNQGQKLPLRNRHGSSKRRRRDESESDDDSDGP